MITAHRGEMGTLLLEFEDNSARTQMTQKPALRAEEYEHSKRASQNRKDPLLEQRTDLITPATGFNVEGSSPS